MHPLIKELQGIRDERLRRAKAESLLSQVRTQMPGLLSSGYPAMNPDNFPKPDFVERYTEEQRRIYDQLISLTGQPAPEILEQAIKRFNRNSAQMIALSRMSEDERQDLPWSKHFPFYDNFDKAVKDSSKQDRLHTDGTIKLEDINFSDTLLGSGAYGEVYLAKAGERELVLKLLKKGVKVKGSQRELMQEKVWAIKNNIRRNMPILQQNLFAAPRIVGGTMADWYVADYFPGKNPLKEVSRLPLTDIEPVAPIDRKRQIIGLARMAEALQYLHQRGLLFMDTSLDAVLVKDKATSPNDAKVVDYDFVTEEEAVRDPNHPFRGLYHPAFVAQEQILKKAPKKITDLEALASNAHFIFADGKSRFGGIDPDHLVDVAHANQFEYVPPRDTPYQIARIMKALLTYPRDNGVKAEDFRSAIKREYAI